MSIVQPKFEEFQSSSSSNRKLINSLFFMLCVAVATLSVVILCILLTTIVISAIPTFGPHSDHLKGNNRFVVLQAESSDETKVDSGDIVQGVFEIDSLERGGLGRTNDLSFASEDQSGSSRFGIYSFEVVEVIQVTDLYTLFKVKPASGNLGLAALLESAGLDSKAPSNACIAVLESSTERFDIANAKFENQLVSEQKLAGQVDVSDGWSIALTAGFAADEDFMELKLNSELVSKIASLRAKKKGGQLNGAVSVLSSNETDKFQSVRVRSFETNELVSSQLKIDAEYLRGLSRRDKNGFQLGGELDLIYCPLSEKSARTSEHIAHFLKEPPKSEAPEAGIGPAILGSLWVIICCAIFALPIGIGTAVYLEELKSNKAKGIWGSFLRLNLWITPSMITNLIPGKDYQEKSNSIHRGIFSAISINISNLAGVPSIVYGILGLTAFAWMFGVFGSVKEPGYQIGADHFYQYVTEGSQVVMIPVDDPQTAPTLTDGMMAQDSDGKPIELKIIGEEDDFPEDDETLARSLLFDAEGGLYSDKGWYYFQLPFGRGVLAASLTLMLVILPVIIIATQEALRAVPSSLREGAMGLGSTPWQVVRKVTLPAAIPSIMTGAILSMSRAIGEAAPVLILCGIVYVTAGPQHLMDTYSVLPIQIYFWTSEPVDRSLLINFQNVAAAGIVVLLVILLSFNAIAILIRQFTQKPLS